MVFTDYDKILNVPKIQEIELPAETLTLLLRYFEAAANLYERIPIRKLMEIFTAQTGISVPDEQLISLMDELNKQKECLYYCLTEEEYYDENAYASAPMERDLLTESVCMFEEDYEEIKASQQGIPYVTLPQEEFLKYEDEQYFEFTPACKEMLHFLMETQDYDRPKATDYLDELMMYATHLDTVDNALDDMVRMGAVFNYEQLERFAALYRELLLHSRTGAYCGNCLVDLPDYQEPEAPDMQVLYQNMQWSIREWEKRRGKINQVKDLIAIPKHQPGTPSKNGPCPCGSGKKYKRCCGKGK